MKLVIFFLLISCLAYGQSDSTHAINLKVNSEKYMERTRLSGQIVVSGLVVGTVGSLVRAENIALTGTGIFVAGMVLFFDAQKFKGTRWKVEGNTIKYNLTK